MALVLKSLGSRIIIWKQIGLMFHNVRYGALCKAPFLYHDNIYITTVWDGTIMLKIAVIFLLLALGFLATKYLDEKAQKKVLVGFAIAFGTAVVMLMAFELFR